MIYVIATIQVKPGQRDDFLAIFNRNVPNVLAEDGCIAYGPAVDVASGLAVQPPLRENTAVIMEQWESTAHLRAHLKTPHMAAYREEVKDMVESTMVQVLEPKA